jgi:translation initiation factor IF-3
VNELIRVARVRLIADDGEQLGIFNTSDAQDIADERGLDLVEVAPNADPPVARIMDYGKYKYEQAMKAKRAKKHQTTIQVKEIKFRPKIDDHDYETKKRHVVRFLNAGAKVKVTIMFRGREMVHAERGLAILDRLAEDVKDLGVVETEPKLEGRNLHMMMASTVKDTHKDEKKDEHADEARTKADAPAKTEAGEPVEAPTEAEVPAEPEPEPATEA